MAAPKIDYEEEFFSGMTVPRLAQLFRLDRRTVTEKLRAVRPTGERRGAPTYHVVDAAPYLVEPIIDIAEYLKNAGPGDLPAALQAQYWNAQNGRLKYLEQSKDLWRTPQVLEVLTTVFRSLSQSLRLLADRVEAQVGITVAQREVIEKEISDKAVNMLRQRLVADFEFYIGIKDKEQLAEIKLDELDEEDDDE